MRRELLALLLSRSLIGCQLNRLEFGGCAFPKISSLGLVFFFKDGELINIKGRVSLPIV